MFRGFGGRRGYRRHREVTPREILVSIIIILIALSLGIGLVSAVENAMAETNEIYYKAIKIDNDDRMFHHAKRTDAGIALVYTDVKALDTVTFPEISGEFMYIEKVREDYTMHTRTVTETDSEGNTRTRTEVYYTWDYVGTESLVNKEVEIFGEIYSSTKFNFDKLMKELRLTKNNFIGDGRLRLKSDGYVYRGSDTRYYYNYVPKEVKSNFLIDFSGNDIKPVGSKSIILRYGTIDERLEEIENSVTVAKIVISFILIVATLFIVFKFVSGYHHWLER